MVTKWVVGSILMVFLISALVGVFMPKPSEAERKIYAENEDVARTLLILVGAAVLTVVGGLCVTIDWDPVTPWSNRAAKIVAWFFVSLFILTIARGSRLSKIDPEDRSSVQRATTLPRWTRIVVLIGAVFALWLTFAFWGS